MNSKSKKSKSSGPPGKLSPWVVVARVLLLGAIGLSSYLAWISLSGSEVAGCGPESSCHEVLNNRWAYWFGIPVSLLALPVYVGLFIATLSSQRKRGAGQRADQLTARAALVFCILIAGAAFWFTGLQYFVIQAFCPYCLSTHLIGLVAAGIIFFKRKQFPFARFQAGSKANASVAILTPKTFVTGALGIAILSVGQILSPYKAPAVATATDESVRIEAPKPERTLSLHEGEFELKLSELPLIGNADADQVIVSLFDYTCIHCRRMHHTLTDVQTRLGDKLAVVNLVSPLDAACNVTMQRLHARTPSAHINACKYAMLGLAVWHANRAASKSFEEWMFEGDRAPPLAEAYQHAAELLGGEAPLESALRDPWVARQLRTNTLIYDANQRKYNKGSMPQLIIGSKITFGNYKSEQELYDNLEEQFGPGFVPEEFLESSDNQ